MGRKDWHAGSAGLQPVAHAKVNQSKTKGRPKAAPWKLGKSFGLERLNVLCLPALGSLDDVKLHGLAFLQAAETAALDGRVMDENVLAILPADETIPLSVVEPLY